MKYVTAIVLAAGRGLRFSRCLRLRSRIGIPTRKSKMVESGNSRVPKPFAKINSKPIIIYSLKILSIHPWVRDIIVVVNTKIQNEIINKIRQYRIGKISRIVRGGRQRQDSVGCGLKAMDSRTDLVLIHDAVRPFINQDTISSLIKEAEKSGAAIVGVPVKATIKKVTKSPSHQVTRRSVVEKTIERKDLWEIQTPQVFKKDLILKAYKKFGSLAVTDDSMLVEKLGVKVSVIPGSYNNIKITTPEDLILAKVIAQKGKKGSA